MHDHQLYANVSISDDRGGIVADEQIPIARYPSDEEIRVCAYFLYCATGETDELTNWFDAKEWLTDDPLAWRVIVVAD